MADVKIRGLDPVVVKKIDELAKRKNISREQYLRNLVTQTAILGELKSIDERYENLVREIMARMEYQTDVLNQATNVLSQYENKVL